MSIDTDSGPAIDDDPHASKISPDDPRLSIQRPRSRVLKMKPIIGCVALLGGIATYTVVNKLNKPDKKMSVSQEPVKVPDRPPTVPPFIQQAPDTPEPTRTVEPLPPSDGARAFAPQPSRPSFDALRPDPLQQQQLQQDLARRADLARAEDEARTSGLFFESGSRAPETPPAAAMGAIALQPPLPASGLAPAAAQSPEGAWDPNFQGRKNAFLDDPKRHPDYLPTSLQRAFSPYEVKATTIIPATLLTGINSDLPGPIIAQVREQVYDTVTGQHLLIPQGARLLASYDSMVAWGQERVLMCWNRIIFPNGSSINLQCMPAADLKGQAGLTDEVDQHWDRLIAAVGLSTVLSLGAQVAAGDPTGYQPTLAQSAARNAAGQINAAGQGVVQRQLNIQPTITVRPGFGVNVIVTKDMVLEPYVE